MRAETHRLAFLLAASGLSDREIMAELKAAERLGNATLIAQVRAIRAAIRKEGWRDLLDVPRAEELKPSTTKNLAKQVDLLLRREAALSAQRAAAVLTRALKDEGVPSTAVPAFRPKKGFASWLNSVARAVSPSMLLHLATRIRNEAIHAPPGDWPLRERKT